ncbi:MAG: multicopper oxidase family protein [Rhizobiales bacterium]|nr:multicopper oxidase family protein [Hyphomicrobiales bacterium]
MAPNATGLLNRRQLVAGASSALALAAIPRARASAPAREFVLTPQAGRARLFTADGPQTEVWAYNALVPGPEIRIKQGERLRVRVDNRLAEQTTVHWHGIRVPNAMDGVPHLTQKPIAPGESFVYEFDCPDAGTFWYHPHQRSHEQVGRGLSGALIVEEPAPYRADRDVTWLVGDWRLGRDGSAIEDFGGLHDISHDGRLGNVTTINGRTLDRFEVRAGERVRLRLINAASARTFGFHFAGHRPQIIALDGQPVAPHEAEDGRIILGPAMRADVVIDMTAKPGDRFAVSDRADPRDSFRLFDLAYSDAAPLRTKFDAVAALPANPLAEPDLGSAERHHVVLDGGMMSRMESAVVDGKRVDIRSMFRSGLMWAINGVSSRDHVHEPMFTLAKGRTYLFEIENRSMWNHPMHLHGHSFRLLSVNGTPRPHREWLDTVLLRPRERAEIAFVADNPGDWMFHCHNLEHQLGGMMGMVRVG